MLLLDASGSSRSTVATRHFAVCVDRCVQSADGDEMSHIGDEMSHIGDEMSHIGDECRKQCAGQQMASSDVGRFVRSMSSSAHKQEEVGAA